MADSPRRTEIWLADLSDPIGHEAAYLRPVLVVSDDPANRYGLATICPIGSAKRGYPTRVEVTAGPSGLDQASYIQAEQVRTISSARLVHLLGRADITAMVEVERVLRLLLRL